MHNKCMRLPIYVFVYTFRYNIFRSVRDPCFDIDHHGRVSGPSVSGQALNRIRTGGVRGQHREVAAATGTLSSPLEIFCSSDRTAQNHRIIRFHEAINHPSWDIDMIPDITLRDQIHTRNRYFVRAKGAESKVQIAIERSTRLTRSIIRPSDTRIPTQGPQFYFFPLSRNFKQIFYSFICIVSQLLALVLVFCPVTNKPTV